MSGDLLPALAKAVTDEKLLTQIYGDLAKPGVTQVGKALSTILGFGNTILWPIQLLNERTRISLKANLDRYREKISSIPTEKIVPIPPEVGVPVVEKLAYVADKDLRELYVELLTKASNIDTQSQAHPSFVNVLNNISPDEAHLLQQIRQKTGVIPFVSARLVNPESGAFMPWRDLEIEVAPETKIAYAGNLPAYLSNLEGLGLIQIRRDIHMLPLEIYDSLKQRITSQSGSVRIGQFSLLQHDLGKIEATQFGWMFFGACCS